MIAAVFLELLGPGGIQRLGRHTAAVLDSLAGELGMACEILSVRDAPGVHEAGVSTLGFRVRGFGGSRGRLSGAFLALAPRARLVYFGHANLASLGLAVRVVARSTPFWVGVYGIDVWERLPVLRRAGLRSAQGVLAISRATAERAARAQGLDRARIHVVAPALEPGFADGAPAPADAAARPGRKVLLTVARLAASEAYKGVDGVIRALPRIRAAVPGASYVVVGDGDDRARLERLAADTGVADAVSFVGRVSEEELRAYYARCDAFVMPSEREGFGIVFLEAMAFSKPVIAGRHGGAPEVVEEGATGFLVDAGDVERLTACIVELLSDSDLAERLGRAGRRRLEERFTFDHFAKRLRRVVAPAITGGDAIVGGARCAG